MAEHQQGVSVERLTTFYDHLVLPIFGQNAQVPKCVNNYGNSTKRSMMIAVELTM